MWEMVYAYDQLKDLKLIVRVLDWAIVRSRGDGYALQIRVEDRDYVLEFLGEPLREGEDTR